MTTSGSQLGNPTTSPPDAPGNQRTTTQRQPPSINDRVSPRTPSQRLAPAYFFRGK